jgi:hypothetical protein
MSGSAHAVTHTAASARTTAVAVSEIASARVVIVAA